jgi:hypothetical protein
MNQRNDLYAMLIEAMVVGPDAMITRQEAQGQRDLVNNATLPRSGCAREELEAMGIIVRADVDDLFMSVTLPAGWKKQATDHSMWSDLLDDQGRKRAAIFYKAAFYDRDASITLCRRINVTRRYGDDDMVSVAVVRDGIALFETEPIKRDLTGRAYFVASDEAERRAATWADEHYPDWRSTAAYWD